MRADAPCSSAWATRSSATTRSASAWRATCAHGSARPRRPRRSSRSAASGGSTCSTSSPATTVSSCSTRSRPTGGTPGTWYRFDAGALRETMNLTNVHDTNFATALELGRRLGMRVPADDREPHLRRRDRRQPDVLGGADTRARGGVSRAGRRDPRRGREAGRLSGGLFAAGRATCSSAAALRTPAGGRHRR